MAPTDYATGEAVGSTPLRCGVCARPTTSLKRYHFVEWYLFLCVLIIGRRITYTACPSCMRTKIIQCALINILPAHILWIVLLLPWYTVLLIASTTDGHSSSIQKQLPSEGIDLPPFSGAGSAAHASVADAAFMPGEALPSRATLPPPVRVLQGESERRRLELSRSAARVDAARITTHARVDFGSRSGDETAAAGLRFVARELELTPQGLRVRDAGRRSRDITWSEIVELIVYQLPIDPPWDGQVVLDLIVMTAPSREVVRIAATTRLGLSSLPGGAPPSRLERIRRLTAHGAAQNGGMRLDSQTEAFALTGQPPRRMRSMSEFVDYDARYG